MPANTKQIAREQRLLMIASVVLLFFVVVLYVVPFVDDASQRFLIGTFGKVGLFFLVVSLAWQPLRKLWARPWGRAIAIGMLVCIVVAAFRPRAIFVVAPIVAAAVGLYTFVSTGSRWLK